MTLDTPRGQQISVFFITEGIDGYTAMYEDDTFPITLNPGELSWEFSRLTANGKIDYLSEGVKHSDAKYVGVANPLNGPGTKFTWLLENFRDED